MYISLSFSFFKYNVFVQYVSYYILYILEANKDIYLFIINMTCCFHSAKYTHKICFKFHSADCMIIFLTTISFHRLLQCSTYFNVSRGGLLSFTTEFQFTHYSYTLLHKPIFMHISYSLYHTHFCHNFSIQIFLCTNNYSSTNNNHIPFTYVTSNYLHYLIQCYITLLQAVSMKMQTSLNYHPNRLQINNKVIISAIHPLY